MKFSYLRSWQHLVPTPSHKCCHNSFIVAWATSWSVTAARGSMRGNNVGLTYDR
jgi:hypothetical protein